MGPPLAMTRFGGPLVEATGESQAGQGQAEAIRLRDRDPEVLDEVFDLSPDRSRDRAFSGPDW